MLTILKMNYGPKQRRKKLSGVELNQEPKIRKNTFPFLREIIAPLKDILFIGSIQVRKKYGIGLVVTRVLSRQKKL